MARGNFNARKLAGGALDLAEALSAELDLFKRRLATSEDCRNILHEKVQALSAEVAGLREDKARLDWASESVVRIASNDAGGAEVDVFRIVGGVAYPAGEHRAATLRAAIDAARQEKKDDR